MFKRTNNSAHRLVRLWVSIVIDSTILGSQSFVLFSKSTVISLLLRFYDSTNGHIFLDGQDLRTLNISWLRSIIGFVQQEPILFNRTIAENIAYGINDREVSPEEIYEVAQQANIHDEIIAFPQVNILYFKLE